MVCGKDFITLQKLFCFLFLLLYLSFSHAETKYCLAEAEMTELETLILESEQVNKMLRADLSEALKVQQLSQENYNEQWIYWLKREEEHRKEKLALEKENHYLWLGVKVGSVTIGIVGFTAYVASLFR